MEQINHLVLIWSAKAARVKGKSASCSNNLIKVRVGASRLATDRRNVNVNYKSRRDNGNEGRGNAAESAREREREREKKRRKSVGIVPNGSH